MSAAIRCAAVLALLLSACAGREGPYHVVRPATYGVGIAITTSQLMTAEHAPRRGDLRLLWRAGKWRRARITHVERVGSHYVEQLAVEGGPLHRGESGTPTFDLEGRLRSFVVGRITWDFP